MSQAAVAFEWPVTSTGFARPLVRRDGAVQFHSRTRLLDLPVARVEDLRCQLPLRAGHGPEAFCSVFQVCLPYQGLFVWHVGKDDVVGDPNQVVFVRAGEPYRMSSPSAPGYAELIVTPDLELLSELTHGNGRPMFEHPLFERRAMRATPALQAARARLHHLAAAGTPCDAMEFEEMVVSLLGRALRQQPDHLAPVTASTRRLIRRTKELLQDRLGERVHLRDVAGPLGVSPAYLTDVFKRVEGVPLHQYLIQLRLASALMELPHAEDLTRLALDLGFSSHSHFTFAFRRAFGCTPSAFRQRTRREIAELLGRN